MAVSLSPGFSIVVRRAAISEPQMRAKIVEAIGPVFSEDAHLTVFGPLYGTEEECSFLDRMGLVYPDDYFDLPHSGGTVPDWCAVQLVSRDG